MRSRLRGRARCSGSGADRDHNDPCHHQQRLRGRSHSITAVYSGDSNDLPATSAALPLTVTGGQTTPAIFWQPPAAITYGTPLGATQLDATSAAAGTFSYSPAAGTVLGVGPQTLSVNFTPTNSNLYSTATATVTFAVTQATPAISWSTPSPITFGTALSGTQLNASSPVAGSFVYEPAAGTLLSAGTHTLSVTFTPTDTMDYTTATALMNLTVSQASPTITWAAPSPITYGTALSATRLNATSTVAGAFVYTPAAGPVLSAGTQTLSVTFTPTDAIDNATATASVTLTVNTAAAAIAGFLNALRLCVEPRDHHRDTHFAGWHADRLGRLLRWNVVAGNGDPCCGCGDLHQLLASGRHRLDHCGLLRRHEFYDRNEQRAQPGDRELYHRRIGWNELCDRVAGRAGCLYVHGDAAKWDDVCRAHQFQRDGASHRSDGNLLAHDRARRRRHNHSNDDGDVAGHCGSSASRKAVPWRRAAGGAGTDSAAIWVPDAAQSSRLGMYRLAAHNRSSPGSGGHRLRWWRQRKRCRRLLDTAAKLRAHGYRDRRFTFEYIRVGTCGGVEGCWEIRAAARVRNGPDSYSLYRSSPGQLS